MMDAAVSAQYHENACDSWHPAMRPNSHRPDETSREQTDQSPPTTLHFTDNEDRAEQLGQPPDGLEGAERPGYSIPLHVKEGDKSSTCLEGTVQSAITVDRDLNDFPKNTDEQTDEQTENIEKRKPGFSEGMLGNRLEDAGASTNLSDSKSQPGPFHDRASHNLSLQGDDVPTEIVASIEVAAEPTHDGNAVGGREEMAKAWDSEPGHAGGPGPGELSRTNSFPQVPPLRQIEIVPPHSLSHSQAQTIMEEDQSAESMDRQPSLDGLPAAIANGGTLQPPFYSTEDENDCFFANSNPIHAADPNVQADQQSRFEEGLPLMPSNSPERFASKGSVHSPNAHKEGDAGEENDAGFFDKTSQESPDKTSSFRPQALDRKSTIQVLDSLHYAPHSATHGDSQSAEERPLLENVTGGGIAVSASVVESQVLAEQQMDLNKAEPKDEDLAEMWKAALGDDDLLEDNEGSLDPSSFFEDDGEGFLDGSEGGTETQVQATAPLPAHAPVYRSEGSMQGFGQINTIRSSSRDRYLPISNSQMSTAPPSTYDYGHSNRIPAHRPLTTTSDHHHSVPAHNGRADTDSHHTNAAPTSSSRPQMPPSTQSFANKSKGGYTSPYDLPMVVSRPKKRSPYQQLHPKSDAQVAPARPPPPRSSSMFTGALSSLDNGPPVPRPPSAVSSVSTGSSLPPPLKASPSISAFFEELPSSKPRPSSSMGRVAHPASQPTQTPPLPPSTQRDPSRQVSVTQQLPPGITGPSQQYQLLPPEKMSLYANASPPELVSQTMPVVNPRYSPAPVQQSNVPPPRNRYAASPSIVGRPVPSHTLSFQPRTSSPLAQNNPIPRGNHQPSVSDPSLHRPTSSGRQAVSAQDKVSSIFSPSYQNGKIMESNAKQSDSAGRIENNSQSRSSPPPFVATHYAPLSNSPSDSSYVMNTPDAENTSSDGSASFQQLQGSPINAPARGLPPRRTQSQSPGDGKYMPELPQTMQNQYQRPASVNNHVSLPSEETRPPINQTRQRERTFSKDLNYIKPSDGRELDSLERWKGCPIISFGFGGTIVTSFPKQVPRYATGQNAPMIRCTPGEVKIQDGKVLPLDEDVTTFPGPLRTKSRKKDVLDWLHRRIAHLEGSKVGQNSSASLPDPRRRHEEKMLLWKIVRVLVEHDGTVDANASAQNAIRSILSPELTVGDTASLPPKSFNTSLLGISRNGGSRSISNLIKPEVMEDLRKLLLHAEQEKAVWHAVDNRLWAHAMLIASTLEKNVWKQVSQEFVRQEVKTFGDNTESLAALYQIFAGNWEESMDELVPPSARAGLQMISKTTTTGPTKNALDGLDRWRETLTLILSNRSVDDEKALVSLGQLLAGYGRTEAAHICYIFAKSPGLFGGPDDSQVSVALLGADHLQQPFDYGRDLDSILLTEVYDFARTVLAPSSAATVSPHLQSYKLYHAMILAEHGYKSEAQQYCEAITSALSSTTKRSPYYHGLLFGALESLVDRLRQAPRDNSGSWISKPSIDKVSGSIWAKFNQYVAGDESDAASTGSGKALDSDVGPFARVVGDSPNLSRTPSSSDMYSTHALGIGVSPTALMSNPSSSRYAPAGLYTPRSSLEQPSNSSQDYQRPTHAQKDSLRPDFASQPYQSRPLSSNGSYPEAYKPTSLPSSYPPHTESYLPTPPSQPEYMPVAPPEDPSYSYQQESYRPTPPLKPESSHEQYQPPSQSESAGNHQPSSTTYEPPSYTHGIASTSGYEPLALTNYSPPAYDTYAAQAGDSPVEEKPKKKSFMDDEEDDDFEARAAALRKEEKARNDREADEAFKRAAEADAQKDKAPKLNIKKSGWFGGWLGGKKEGDAADAHGTPNAPIKAKLGEQNSFYYDSEKKRWVNKKDPDGTAAVAPAPPPPKGPPSRVVSSAGPPRPSSTAPPPVPPLPTAMAPPPINVTRPTPSNPPSSNPASQYPSRSPSPAVNAPPTTEEAATANEPSAAPMLSAIGRPSGPPSAPPSRPATGMSGASSIDDLIGVPQARKGGTVRKGKKGRGYVDVMAK